MAYRGAKSTFNTAHTGATMIKNKTADMIGERKAATSAPIINICPP